MKKLLLKQKERKPRKQPVKRAVLGSLEDYIKAAAAVQEQDKMQIAHDGERAADATADHITTEPDDAAEQIQEQAECVDVKGVEPHVVFNTEDCFRSEFATTASAPTEQEQVVMQIVHGDERTLRNY